MFLIGKNVVCLWILSDYMPIFQSCLLSNNPCLHYKTSEDKDHKYLRTLRKQTWLLATLTSGH